MPIREVRRAHGACGSETRIRLPRALPESAVRRVVCDSCRESFQVEPPADDPAVRGARGFPAPPLGLPGRLREGRGAFLDGVADLHARLADSVASGRLSHGRLWAWASVPLAALGVVAGLLLLRGDTPPPASAPVSEPLASDASANARFVEGSGFSLALPTGWKEVEPPPRAAFAAESSDGSANATLWIERAPRLSLKRFERRSLVQLGELGGDPRVVDRVEGPTLESSLVELRADGPLEPGLPPASYRVTLRGAGELRHYFASVTEPGAGPVTVGGVELLHGSLRPEVGEG